MSVEASDKDPWTLPLQRSLPAVVAERVVEAIRTGELKPGERIVELQLAKKLGVSRGPLREALKSLEAIHLVESRRSKGTYVTNVSASDVLNMAVVRAVLEGLAARLVAGRRTPEMVATLTELHRQIEAAAKAGKMAQWRDLDWRFHETVCRVSGNEFLLGAWQSISNLVRLFLHDHPAFERAVGGVLENHDRMLEVLRSGTPDEADALFRSVILRSAFSRLKMELPEAILALAAIESADPLTSAVHTRAPPPADRALDRPAK
jgi:DNA-binding GntR family transcriptional regulator